MIRVAADRGDTGGDGGDVGDIGDRGDVHDRGDVGDGADVGDGDTFVLMAMGATFGEADIAADGGSGGTPRVPSPPHLAKVMH